MVAVVVTPEIKAILSGTKSDSFIKSTSNIFTISHTHLASALRTKRHFSLSKNKNNDIDNDTNKQQQIPSLKTLLGQTSIYPTHEDAIYHLIPHKRNTELEQRVAKLRQRLEDAQYNHMVRDVSRVNPANNLQIEATRMNKLAPQMSLGFNVIVTMATCFTAAYYVFKHSTGNQTIGLIAGVIALIVAMIVEIILLLTKMYSIDGALQKKEQQNQQQRNNRIQASPVPRSRQHIH